MDISTNYRIRDLQRVRRASIKAESRCDRSIESLISGGLQSVAHRAGREISRKDGFKIAGEIREAIETQAKFTPLIASATTVAKHQRALKKVEEATQVLEPYQDFIRAYDGIVGFVLLSAASREPWAIRRAQTDLDMRTIAHGLPVWAHWASDIRGFSDLGLAIIVGEAGDLSDYPTKGKLFKRLGLGVFDGRRQGNPVDKADYAEHGYNPERRSQVWVFLSDILYNQQAKTDPVGHYAQICRDHKAQAVDRNEAGINAELAAQKLKHNPGSAEAKYWSRGLITPGHIDRRSRRYMSKIFLTDLRQAWFHAEGISVRARKEPSDRS